jgi:hypothetical protein
VSGAVSTIGRSRQAKALFFFAAAVGLALALSTWVISGSSQMLVMGAMAVTIVMIVVSTLNNWRTGLYLFILWLLFEDLARKYMGNNTILFFGKDVLAAITIFSLFRSKQRREVPWFKPPFLASLIIFFAFAVIQVFNTESPSVVYGLLGLKLYFYYVPMMYVGYALLRTNQDLEWFLVYNIVPALLIAVGGIAQSVVGLGFLNPTQLAPELQELGNLSRESPLTHQRLFAPTSVFVSTGRFASYIILAAIILLGAQAYLLLTRRRRAWWALLGVSITFVAALQSGSRGSVIYTGMSVLVLSGGFLWGAPWRWGQGHRLAKAFRRAALVCAAGLFLMAQFFPDKIGASWAFFSETLSPASSASELQHRGVDYPMQGLQVALQSDRLWSGGGTGTASLGAQYVAQLLGQPPLNAWVENGWGVLILEMGVLGLILWIIWTATLLVAGWKVVKQLRETIYFPVALSIFWYLFLLLAPFTYMGMAPYQNYVLNAYCWVLVGILFRLPYLARTQQLVLVRSTIGASEVARVQARAGGQ